MACLRFFSKDASIVERRVDKETLLIGRDLCCDVVLNYSYVSRRHGQITSDGKLFVYEDLGSTHGTRINNKPVKVPHVLKDHDIVQIGDIFIEFLDAQSESRLLTDPAGGGASGTGDFKELPDLIEGQWRTVTLEREDIPFRPGDTLRIGDSGLFIRTTSEIPGGRIIELRLVMPNGKAYSILAEALFTGDFHGVTGICLKMHQLPQRTVAECLLLSKCRGEWIPLRQTDGKEKNGEKAGERRP